MLVKLDENLSITHVEFLRDEGYDCDRVTDEGLSGEDDEVVWQQACAEGRFFVPLDLDFSDVRRFPLLFPSGYFTVAFSQWKSSGSP